MEEALGALRDRRHGVPVADVGVAYFERRVVPVLGQVARVAN
jgi:hypothetical protein